MAEVEGLEAFLRSVIGNLDERTSGEVTSSRLPRILLFPYSRHSSYPELKHLVGTLKPRDVWPCTAVPSDWLREGASKVSELGIEVVRGLTRDWLQAYPSKISLGISVQKRLSGSTVVSSHLRHQSCQARMSHSRQQQVRRMSSRLPPKAVLLRPGIRSNRSIIHHVTREPVKSQSKGWHRSTR